LNFKDFLLFDGYEHNRDGRSIQLRQYIWNCIKLVVSEADSKKKIKLAQCAQEIFQMKPTDPIADLLETQGHNDHKVLVALEIKHLGRQCTSGSLESRKKFWKLILLKLMNIVPFGLN
jgi:hypothetical protein